MLQPLAINYGNALQTNSTIKIPEWAGRYNTPSLGLNQIDGFVPVQKFTDETNTEWTLVKASSDSTVDIPNPKNMQVLDYWNHEFPGLKTKLYVYVVEGMRQPRVETEQLTKILYQWFSTIFIPSFTPEMITEKEWLKANVYAAPVVSSRLSKLRAICKISDLSCIKGQNAKKDELIKVEGISDENAPKRDTERS